jgi:serine/threonine protein kinase
MSLTQREEQTCERFSYVPTDAVLGQGAYGLVWRAIIRQTGTWYAVKNIRSRRRGNNEIAAREFLIADRIRFQPHPCLVGLYHVKHFVDAGLYCLVLEFCPGGDLLKIIQKIKQRAFIERKPYVAPDQAPRWLAQIFLGLEHMHLRMETLLRDLKPENCVITAKGRVKITDFGFGRFGIESTGQWSFGIPTGSPGYVAPEILQRQKYDSGVDLYSMGVLGWVALTGGLTNSMDALPPLGVPRYKNDFRAHDEDWLLLARCIASPEGHLALPLSDVARDLIARLTHQTPVNRPKHAEIRSHRFMQPLNLPSFDARLKEVEAWLASLDAGKDGSVILS